MICMSFGGKTYGDEPQVETPAQIAKREAEKAKAVADKAALDLQAAQNRAREAQMKADELTRIEEERAKAEDAVKTDKPADAKPEAKAETKTEAPATESKPGQPDHVPVQTGEDVKHEPNHQEIAHPTMGERIQSPSDK